MDKYHKIYNENFLGTSDVSILKFYYASFKIQQGKGKVSNVGSFLDECAKISDDTSPISQANRIMTKEESLQLVKEKILKCYSIQGKKQLGDRIFGYLLKSELFTGSHTGRTLIRMAYVYRQRYCPI